MWNGGPTRIGIASRANAKGNGKVSLHVVQKWHDNLDIGFVGHFHNDRRGLIPKALIPHMRGVDKGNAVCRPYQMSLYTVFQGLHSLDKGRVLRGAIHDVLVVIVHPVTDPRDDNGNHQQD
eukprot:scaffold609_cov170-Amphora_coffeaeformis.AAC.56